jgi:hypothetical protein
MKSILFSLTVMLSSAVFAQSTCESAMPIQAGLHTVDTIMGQLPLPVCAQNGNGETDAGEWYTYTAAENYTIHLTTSLPQNEGLDTRVHIYSGTCENLVCLAGDDDGGDVYLSDVYFLVLEGQTVYIAFDNRWDSRGFDFEITEAEYVAPAISFIPVDIESPGSELGAVDMNGDYLDDVVAYSGASGNFTMNYQTAEGTLTPVSLNNNPPANGPSWSLTAGDLDANGINDLMLGGGSGVTFLFANEDGTQFTEVSGNEYVFSQRGNMVDIDNDGNLDAFMCHDVQPNVYYMNDGAGSFLYNQGGLGDVPDGGNYGSIWIDYELDGDVDLFIAKCRGGNGPAKINELHQNNGDGTFTNVAPDLGLNDPLQTWSSAWGDFDNDGDFDVFIGASSFSDGSHKLLQNNGDGTFTDITAVTGFAEVGGTGIENITRDFDNDGFLDILGCGGGFFKNNGDMTFTEFDIQPTNGPVGDLNNDGFLDIVNQQVFLNSGNANSHLTVTTVGTESNLNGIGAVVYVTTPNGTYMRQVTAGDGFRYMNSLNVHFGLGEAETITDVTIHWPSGNIDQFTNVDINSHVVLEEGGAPLSTGGADELPFLVYPNPARDEVFVDVPGGFSKLSFVIFDLTGRMVKQGISNANSINVSTLSQGTYILQLNIDGRLVEQKIFKD